MVDIKKIVIKAISDASVPNAESLREDISLTDQGVDSLGMFTIVMNVQDSCGIEIPDSDLDKIKSISEFVDYLSGKLV